MTRPATLRWSRVGLILLVVTGTFAGGWYAFGRAKPLFGQGKDAGQEPKPPAVVAVEVVSPQPGGIDRVCVQPGTVEPYESADLYAKVSGFLVEQTVDIGSRV